MLDSVRLERNRASQVLMALKEILNKKKSIRNKVNVESFNSEITP